MVFFITGQGWCPVSYRTPKHVLNLSSTALGTRCQHGSVYQRERLDQFAGILSTMDVSYLELNTLTTVHTAVFIIFLIKSCRLQKDL